MYSTINRKKQSLLISNQNQRTLKMEIHNNNLHKRSSTNANKHMISVILHSSIQMKFEIQQRVKHNKKIMWMKESTTNIPRNALFQQENPTSMSSQITYSFFLSFLVLKVSSENLFFAFPIPLACVFFIAIGSRPT